ncbi:MAG: hypothetical protein LQ340_003734 [Diploschistes diacapsis]|nr:MAG: hypothetical protein LQ340_003734 [Diploschistes diacapsis]
MSSQNGTRGSPPAADLAQPTHSSAQPLLNAETTSIAPLTPNESSDMLNEPGAPENRSDPTQSRLEHNLPPDDLPSTLAPSTAATQVPNTSVSRATDQLAEISQRVSMILAPVHALEASKSTNPAPEGYISSFSINAAHTTPSIITPIAGISRTPVTRGASRGRGSRRRGNHFASGTIVLDSNVPGTLLTPPSYSSRSREEGRGRGSRGGRGRSTGRGGKRRRTDESGPTSDSDGSENFTPLTQSRSGRKIIQATASTPLVKIEDDETKASPSSGRNGGNVGGRGSGKKRINFRKTPGGATAVCKNCGRGHSPSSNAIVFCDGCNTPWHQFCHDSPIGKDIVVIAEKEWLCSDCVVMKEERIRLQGKVAGQNLSMREKRRYLQSLPSKELVSLLLHACLLHPDLPVFTQATNGDDGAGIADVYYEDEDLLPYPKAGNGVILRPEKETVNILLDDDTAVFSHTTSGIAEMVAAATASGFASQAVGRTTRVAG